MDQKKQTPNDFVDYLWPQNFEFQQQQQQLPQRPMQYQLGFNHQITNQVHQQQNYMLPNQDILNGNQDSLQSPIDLFQNIIPGIAHAGNEEVLFQITNNRNNAIEFLLQNEDKKTRILNTAGIINFLCRCKMKTKCKIKITKERLRNFMDHFEDGHFKHCEHRWKEGRTIEKIFRKNGIFVALDGTEYYHGRHRNNNSMKPATENPAGGESFGFPIDLRNGENTIQLTPNLMVSGNEHKVEWICDKLLFFVDFEHSMGNLKFLKSYFVLYEKDDGKSYFCQFGNIFNSCSGLDPSHEYCPLENPNLVLWEVLGPAPPRKAGPHIIGEKKYQSNSGESIVITSQSISKGNDSFNSTWINKYAFWIKNNEGYIELYVFSTIENAVIEFNALSAQHHNHVKYYADVPSGRISKPLYQEYMQLTKFDNFFPTLGIPLDISYKSFSIQVVHDKLRIMNGKVEKTFNIYWLNGYTFAIQLRDRRTKILFTYHCRKRKFYQIDSTYYSLYGLYNCEFSSGPYSVFLHGTKWWDLANDTAELIPERKIGQGCYWNAVNPAESMEIREFIVIHYGKEVTPKFINDFTFLFEYDEFNFQLWTYSSISSRGYLLQLGRWPEATTNAFSNPKRIYTK